MAKVSLYDWCVNNSREDVIHAYEAANPDKSKADLEKMGHSSHVKGNEIKLKCPHCGAIFSRLPRDIADDKARTTIQCSACSRMGSAPHMNVAQWFKEKDMDIGTAKADGTWGSDECEWSIAAGRIQWEDEQDDATRKERLSIGTQKNADFKCMVHGESMELQIRNVCSRDGVNGEPMTVRKNYMLTCCGGWDEFSFQDWMFICWNLPFSAKVPLAKNVRYYTGKIVYQYYDILKRNSETYRDMSIEEELNAPPDENLDAEYEENQQLGLEMPFNSIVSVLFVCKNSDRHKNAISDFALPLNKVTSGEEWCYNENCNGCDSRRSIEKYLFNTDEQTKLFIRLYSVTKKDLEGLKYSEEDIFEIRKKITRKLLLVSAQSEKSRQRKIVNIIETRRYKG